VFRLHPLKITLSAAMPAAKKNFCFSCPGVENGSPALTAEMFLLPRQQTYKK
jgi:hypothetical protein